jgi:hypothetical protein
MKVADKPPPPTHTNARGLQTDNQNGAVAWRLHFGRPEPANGLHLSGGLPRVVYKARRGTRLTSSRGLPLCAELRGPAGESARAFGSCRLAGAAELARTVHRGTLRE